MCQRRLRVHSLVERSKQMEISGFLYTILVHFCSYSAPSSCAGGVVKKLNSASARSVVKIHSPQSMRVTGKSSRSAIQREAFMPLSLCIISDFSICSQKRAFSRLNARNRSECCKTLENAASDLALDRELGSRLLQRSDHVPRVVLEEEAAPEGLANVVAAEDVRALAPQRRAEARRTANSFITLQSFIFWSANACFSSAEKGKQFVYLSTFVFKNQVSSRIVKCV